MFSLIITIISIALVAALALATLYYGGAAFNKSSVDAEASRILLQGQQLLGAAELYFSEHRAWPTMQQLLDGDYLKSVPSVQGPMGQALAASTLWTTPVEGAPIFKLATDIPEVCRGVNRRAYKFDGILKEVRSDFAIQCYGTALNDLHTIITRGGKFLTDANGDPDVGPVSSGGVPDPNDSIVLVKPTDPRIPNEQGRVGGSEDPGAPATPTGAPPSSGVPGGLSATPSPVAFASTAIGVTSNEMLLLINNSSKNVTLSSVTGSVSQVTGTFDGVPYSEVNTVSCASLSGLVLTAGTSCAMTAQVTPSVAGPVSGYVTIAGTSEDGPMTLNVGVSGGGVVPDAGDVSWLLDTFTGPDTLLTDTVTRVGEMGANPWESLRPGNGRGAWVSGGTLTCPGYRDLDYQYCAPMQSTATAPAGGVYLEAKMIFNTATPVDTGASKNSSITVGFDFDGWNFNGGGVQILYHPTTGFEVTDMYYWDDLDASSLRLGQVNTVRVEALSGRCYYVLNGSFAGSRPCPATDGKKAGVDMYDGFGKSFIWDADFNFLGYDAYKELMFLDHIKGGTLTSPTFAYIEPPAQAPQPQASTLCPSGGSPVHLAGGYQPNRLNVDQFLAPAGWYDLNGTPTYYSRGWAYMCQ